MCENREEVGKRKGGLTCTICGRIGKGRTVIDLRQCVGGMRGSGKDPDGYEHTYISSSEETSL